MLEAITYQAMLEDISRNNILEDTIGILITRPELEVGKDILSSLNYYHHASSKNVNFYLPGYGAYWHGTYPDGRVVTKINGVDWSFSDSMFVQFVGELQAAAGDTLARANCSCWSIRTGSFDLKKSCAFIWRICSGTI